MTKNRRHRYNHQRLPAAQFDGRFLKPKKNYINLHQWKLDRSLQTLSVEAYRWNPLSQLRGHARDNRRPVSRRRLTKQAHCRIP